MVTAGASAAWGSDAVAGGDNLVLDRKFSGIGASADIGDLQCLGSSQLSRPARHRYRLCGRPRHLTIAGGHSASPEVIFRRAPFVEHLSGADGKSGLYRHQQRATLHPRHQYRAVAATTGGLITGGPLRGIQFVGPAATPARFDFDRSPGRSPPAAMPSSSTPRPTISPWPFVQRTCLAMQATSSQIG